MSLACIKERSIPMKTLILLRHAKALDGPVDISRTLAKEALGQLERLAAFWGDHHLRVDTILCSPSRRTRQTLEGLQHHGMATNAPIIHHPDFYDGTIEAFMRAIEDLEEEVSSVLLVGHNPTLYTLVRHFEPVHSFAPCSCFVVQLKTHRWDGVMEAPVQDTLLFVG
jgi:phosphohistidine phosphatase SixA